MEFVEYTIGQLAKSIHTGKTPPSQKEEYFKEEINWITPSDMDGRKSIDSTIRKVSKSALNDNYVFLHQKNTIVLGTKGDIGKVCIIDIPSASNDQTTGVFLNSDIILPELFYYWVKLNKGMLEFKANKAVIAILSNKHLRKIKVSFPQDITDQQKIVSNLNAIQFLINQKIKALDILEQLRRSFYFELIGDPILNNFNHSWEYLGDKDHFKFTSGLTPSRAVPRFYNGEIPWIKSANVKNDFIDSADEFISQLAIENTSARIFPVDSVLIAMYGQGKTKGSVGILKIDASCNQACAVIYPTTAVKPIILFSQLLYSYNYIRSLGRGANRDNLSLDLLKKIKILIPEEYIQLRFEIIFNLIKSIEVQFKEQLEIFNNLFDSYLYKSFDGEIKIKEEKYFEDLISSFSKEEIQEFDRIPILIDWIESNKFSSISNYDIAYKHLLSLLNDGVIEQVYSRGKVKLAMSK